METTLNFIQSEQKILHFWEENKTFQALMEKNAQGEPFRFLDGPITANNPMGVHHAWGRSLKDMILRYKAMTGHSCHYRNGFDTQGLWVEVEVEKELGFKGKKDIESYGLENFTNHCVARIQKFSGIITEQSKRLGQWMDWENSYYTHKEENITGIWHFLKKCDENGWIEQSYRPMPWCPRCGTSLSEHEMSGSHKELTHTSVFAKLPVKERDFDILVWTTTPWTLVANAALAVNPTLTYVLVALLTHEKPLVMAKSALRYVDGEKRVMRSFKGDELVGLTYEPFFVQLPIQQFVHSIVAWHEVADGEGSGVVHIAPGCGTEDFELGIELNLPQICPIDESGVFGDEYDFIKGMNTIEAGSVIFKGLKEQNKLYKTMEYTHPYPVCWRCKHEVLFRLVRSWIIKTDEIRPKLIAVANKVKWEPAYIGKRMEDWLQNMGDWNISRKRFYGLPLPFYPCSCGRVTVVGSKEELRKLGGKAVDELPELHRPWIDTIAITCPHCGKAVQRISEVGDVWLDAGITPFSTLGYFTDKEKWKTYFPAQWVTEMREQVRLWFYSLLFMSVTLTGEAPYERVLGYNSVVAEDGTKFSKTGFMIDFDEAAARLGADTIRYLFAGAPTSSDMRFGFSLGEEARRKIMGFWNICVFFETYAKISKPHIHSEIPKHFTDLWTINRVNLFVEEAMKGYEAYRTADVIKAFEACTEDLSNWYVRINRRRFWDNEDAAFSTLYVGIKTMTQVMAPILPFLSERIWQELVLFYEPEEAKSVHLSDFPRASVVVPEVLEQAQEARRVIAMALKLRNEVQLKIKQPLSTLFVLCEERTKIALQSYEKILLDELNVKNRVFLKNADDLEVTKISLQFKIAGNVLKGDLQRVKQLLDTLSKEEMAQVAQQVQESKPISLSGYALPLDSTLFILEKKSKPHIALTREGGLLVALHTELSPELIKEGIYREILRQCQIMRKEIGLDIEDKIRLGITSESLEILAVISEFAPLLQGETLAQQLLFEKWNLRHEKQITLSGETIFIGMESTTGDDS